MPRRPLFTFVATSRNDDHGGDVLRRTQSFINRLAEQCERHRVAAELIMVEWNPPESRAPLADVLGWPRGSEWFTARMMTIPRRLHLAHAYGSRLSLFQMIGKNIGIRRAAGAYVIATNIDIIFSDELFEWLRAGQFRDGVLYRSDRWDIPNEIQLEPDLDVLLRRARNEAIRQNRREGTFVKRDGVFVNATPDRFDDAFYNAMEHCLKQFREQLTQNELPSADELLKRYDALLTEDLPRLRRNYLIPLLHTNGCGDFTMLSRHDWFRLRGYPEWNIFSWTIDSVLLYQVHYNGMEIEELDPACVHYHIEHDYGSGWTPEGAGSLWARMEHRGIPYMSYQQFTEIAYELQDNAARGLFTIYNGPDWALSGRGVEIADIVTNGSEARPPLTANNGRLNEDFFAGLMPIDLDRSCIYITEGCAVSTAGEGDALEFTITSRPERWSYAVEVDLIPAARTAGEYWLIAEVAVDEGVVGFALLDAAKADFVAEQTLSADGAWHEVVHFVKDADAISQLICRSVGNAGEPARFRLRRLRLLADWPAESGATLAEQPGEANDTPPSATPEFDMPWSEAGAEAAIIRYLTDRDDGSDAVGLGGQMLVVTGRDYGSYGRVLDAPALRSDGGRVFLDVHVIDGPAAIGIRSNDTGEMLVEEVADSGPPFTRIDLDLTGVDDNASLVIRNLSRRGATKVLVHRVDCDKGPVSSNMGPPRRKDLYELGAAAQ